MTPVPVKDRLRKSRDLLRERGGIVTTLRLSPEAAHAAQALIASGYAADRRGVIERAVREAHDADSKRAVDGV